MSGPQVHRLTDGRLHLQHGPIDLIIDAEGAPGEIAAAFAQAAGRFCTVLDELVAELPLLRRGLDQDPPRPEGTIARCMVRACARHRGVFITPMAAVAGAVADAVLGALAEGRTLTRAYVNNGGDIALLLEPGTVYDVGLVADVRQGEIVARARIDASQPVRGIATSGQGGRSLSLGIADAVTVLAADAADADAAATLIANAVDVASPAVVRKPASMVREDSDLGDLPVVIAVGALSGDDIARALDSGKAVAERMRATGLIEAAFLALRGRHRIVSRPLHCFAAAPTGEAEQRAAISPSSSDLCLTADLGPRHLTADLRP
ncbi:MAG: UPF0280 family protein [Rhodospirillales bacterium]|nr:UPF0280 family protein [Rhodospirillales bacterium]